MDNALLERINPEWQDWYPELTGALDSRLRGNDNHTLYTIIKEQ